MPDHETGRRLAAVLAADVAGYSRLASTDEERTLARLRALRGDLVDPAIAAHRGHAVKRAGDGTIVEFRSVIDAARCALEVQQGMVERNHGLAPERQILFRIGIHIGDVVGEADGDLMGDGVNIAARLEGIADPGGIVLSDDAYRQVRDRLDVAFSDLGEQSLKNIARPVRVFAIAPAEAPLPTSPRLRGEEKQREALRGAGPAAEQGPPRLSIVVLPFANIGGDPEQEYFVDGVTESLTTDLSRISGSFVIARNTAFTYKGKPVDVKQLGRDLNVRYVLEGSVQRGGNRLRVNVQFIDAETGNHLWAERFDKPVADLFDMQDEIVARLANQLGAQMIEAEARRAEKSANPDAVDLFFQGQAMVNKGARPDNLRHARELFDRAVGLDSGNIEALSYRGWIDALLGGGSFSDDRDARLAGAEASFGNVLAVAPNHAATHMFLGYLQIHTDRALQGIAELGQALRLDRNLANAHAIIGQGKYYLGRGEETHPHIEEAFRLSPRDSWGYTWLFFDGAAALQIGRHEEAAALLRRSIEANPNLSLSLFFRAAALAHLGRLKEAHDEARAGLAVDPTFTIRRLRASSRAASSNSLFHQQREHVIEGMREAGVPEG
jgi:TolB-like protein/class 3 adenylate cyclase